MTSTVPPNTTQQDSFALRWQVVEGSLRIAAWFDGGTYRLALAGELDLTNAGTFTAELQRSERTEAETVIVDMSRLEFIDSTGVAVLVAAWRRAEADARSLMIAPSTAASVRRVLDLTGLTDRLPVAPEPPPER